MLKKSDPSPLSFQLSKKVHVTVQFFFSLPYLIQNKQTLYLLLIKKKHLLL